MKDDWFFYLIPIFMVIAVPSVITYNANQDRIQYQNTLRSVLDCRMKQKNVADADRLCGPIPKYSDYF